MSDKPKDEKKGTEWTPDKINAVFQGIDILASKYLSFRDTSTKHEVELVKTTSKHDRKIITILLIFLGAMIAGMTALTWFDKIDGAALMFAVGLTIGYVFAIITKFVFGTNNSGDETEE